MRQQFFRVFLPAALVVLLMTSLIYRNHYGELADGLGQRLSAEATLHANNLAGRILQVGRSMKHIAQKVEEDEEFSLSKLQRDMEGYLLAYPDVIQLRLLDNEGMEVLRFDEVNDKVIERAGDELQNKKNRPYFFNNNNLEAGQLAFTAINLNVEHGTIQRPYQLVSRWITPIHDNSGARRGLLIANIDMNALLNHEELLRKNNLGTLLVRSSEGAIYFQNKIYYGQTADSLTSYLGMTEEGWTSITREGTGFFAADEYTDFNEALRFHNREYKLNLVEREREPTDYAVLIDGEAYWAIVHIDILNMAFIQFFFLVIVAFFSFRWARFRVNQIQTIQELHATNQTLKQREIELAEATKELEGDLRMKDKSLFENQRLLSTLFDSSTHYAGVMDINGKLIDVNKMTLDTVGIVKDYVLGKTIWDLEIFGDKEMVKQNMRIAIDKAIHGETVRYESTMRDRNGKYRRVAFSLTPLFDENGQVKHLIPEGVDITELHEKDRQLRALVDQMETRNAQLKEFSHIISHNIRSPIGNLQLLLGILDDAETEEEKNEILGKLDEVNRSLQDLLEELLETVKILDNSEIKSEWVQIQPCIEQAKRLLTRQIEESQAEITLDLSASDEVYFPRVYLSSLILNLMSNAIKYRSDKRPLIIDIHTYIDEKKRTVLEFKDNGSGIDMKRHGHQVFGLYKTFHRNKNGKGLGLFMTKTQIESSGGRIQVNSQLEKGTTFTITFPPQPNHIKR